MKATCWWKDMSHSSGRTSGTANMLHCFNLAAFLLNLSDPLCDPECDLLIFRVFRADQPSCCQLSWLWGLYKILLVSETGEPGRECSVLPHSLLESFSSWLVDLDIEILLSLVSPLCSVTFGYCHFLLVNEWMNEDFIYPKLNNSRHTSHVAFI